MMEALQYLGDFFEWLQEAIEKRWGEFWAWTIYCSLLLLVVGGSIWFILHDR
jgi:hypothetical protein